MKINKKASILIIVLSALLIVCIIVIAILHHINSNNKELIDRLDLYAKDSILPYDVVEKLKDNGYTFYLSYLDEINIVTLTSPDSKIQFFKTYVPTSKCTTPVLSFSNEDINDKSYYIYGMPLSSSGLSEEEKLQMQAFNSWLFDIGLTENQIISAIEYWEATPLLQ